MFRRSHGRKLGAGASLVAALALVGSSALAAPAGAAPAVGGGVVRGTVTTSAPLAAGCIGGGTYNFASVTLGGTFDDGNGNAYVGGVTVNGVTGGTAATEDPALPSEPTGQTDPTNGQPISVPFCPSGSENAAGGEGTVNSMASPFTCTTPGGGVPASIGSLTCSLSGDYLRLGPVVQVDLHGTICVNGQACVPVSIEVVALFLPDPVALATNPTGNTHFDFAGAFVVDPVNVED